MPESISRMRTTTACAWLSRYRLSEINFSSSISGGPSNGRAAAGTAAFAPVAAIRPPRSPRCGRSSRPSAADGRLVPRCSGRSPPRTRPPILGRVAAAVTLALRRLGASPAPALAPPLWPALLSAGSCFGAAARAVPRPPQPAVALLLLELRLPCDSLFLQSGLRRQSRPF